MSGDMKLTAVCCLLLASFVVKATCVSNSEFFMQIKDKGDVEDIDAVPDVADDDDDTVILKGDQDDELDDEHLSSQLAPKRNNEVSDEAERSVSGQKPWHVHFHYRHGHFYHHWYHRCHHHGHYYHHWHHRCHHHGHYWHYHHHWHHHRHHGHYYHHWHHHRHHGHYWHHHRHHGHHGFQLKNSKGVAERSVTEPYYYHYRYRTYHQYRHRNGINRCVSKNIIVKFEQPKKVTQTYCFRSTKLTQFMYHVTLVQDEHVLFDNKILMTGPSKQVCGPFRSAPERNACMNFRLEGSSLCASVAADLSADHKMHVDFGCPTFV